MWNNFHLKTLNFEVPISDDDTSQPVDGYDKVQSFIYRWFDQNP